LRAAIAIVIPLVRVLGSSGLSEEHRLVVHESLDVASAYISDTKTFAVMKRKDLKLSSADKDVVASPDEKKLLEWWQTGATEHDHPCPSSLPAKALPGDLGPSFTRH